ncbi:MAG: carbon-phosphorus lyase complex subunit PhnI [Meiothermus sp.]|uniref:carbon-phosphorus lyase complex subunit PhnI n=1 Tax=Meiothermus sp. TaxID=1955249 RepID=UPI0025E9A582|nr:carbon-phosphorus lyase complex subunit PhnI [Meiothermus sp.]MCS7068548.1 carbon-phosphorus lyase complex subunit PhnI [Meiothermus sp.]
MAYVAARGGEEAIQQAEALYRRLLGPLDAGLVRRLEQALPYLLDRLMGEGSLYAPELAALALAQTGGDLYEAVLLLRAYRTTLPRLGYAEPLEPEALLTVRRISAAFKDIPGGQVLGPTLDYSHRLLHFEPQEAPPARTGAEAQASLHLPFVADWHRQNGLLAPRPPDPTPGPEIPDLTREPLLFPAPRAQRLQALSRADTGGVLALGYANMRGYGAIHPTVNEVRLAYAEVRLRHPVTGAVFSAGRVRYSQAEVLTKFRPGPGGKPALELGFAATLGWNEVKLIAAAMLDAAMDQGEPHPAHTEEFVLSHTEPVEAGGFCIHYKLPHYVTFLSNLLAHQGQPEEVEDA